MGAILTGYHCSCHQLLIWEPLAVVCGFDESPWPLSC